MMIKTGVVAAGKTPCVITGKTSEKVIEDKKCQEATITRMEKNAKQLCLDENALVENVV